MTPPSENGGLTRRNLFIGTAAAIGSGILTACGGVTDRTAELQAAVDLRTMSGMHGISSGTSTASLDVRGLTTDATAGFFQPAVRSSVDGQLSTVLSVAHTPVTIGTQVVQAVTYEQSYPGPTLEIRPGDTLRVQLANDTDENTNLHTHGLHVSPSGNSDNVLLTIEPGQRFDYEYDIPDDHPGGTLWYHAHLHGLSDKQVFGGLFGLLVLRGEFDELPGIAGLPERVMILSQIDIADDEIVDGSDSSVGNQATLVNGQFQPTLDIAQGEVQRWRICNASSVFYRLRLAGRQMFVVNIDGNSLTATTATDVLIVPPGGRADVLVRGGDPGESSFESMSWADLGLFYTANMVPKGQSLIRVVTIASVAAEVAMPTTLLPMKDLRDVLIDRRREFVLEEREPRGVGPNSHFNYFINGTQFDHHVVNETMKLNTTEEWEFINLTYEPHPVHIHVNPFQVISINGEPSGENHYRDSAMVPPFGRIVIRHQFLDYTGKFVMHCHILFHEDHGMMQLLEVVE